MGKDKPIRIKSSGIKGIIKQHRMTVVGLTSRIRGHVAARVKRLRARKDSRNQAGTVKPTAYSGQKYSRVGTLTATTMISSGSPNFQ